MSPPKEWWAELTQSHVRLGEAMQGMGEALEHLVPKVFDAITVALDANGQASGQYRVPYRCLAVDSQSAHVLTVANVPLGTPPGAGAGVGFVRIGGMAVLNIRGYTWSVYGGAAGELITVTAYGNPQPPFAR